MLSSLLLPVKMFFSLLPLSQTSWEGYAALCVQRHSLFIFTSFIRSFSYSRGAMSKEEGEDESFTWTRRAIGGTRPQKCRETERGRVKGREKGDPSLFCALLYLLRFGGEWQADVWVERECLFSLRPCHGKHACALWDLFIPWYTAHAHPHVHKHTPRPLFVLPHTHGHGGGERSSTSVMEQEVLEQSMLHNIQLPLTCGRD